MMSAKTTFTHFPNCNVFILNSMIRGFSSNGLYQEALHVFIRQRRQGVEPDSYTFSCVLKVCASLSDLSLGRSLHQLDVQCGFESDLFVCNSLISMYAKCGCLDTGIKVFERMPKRDVVSWNSIVSAYGVNGFEVEAVENVSKLFGSGLKPDQATVVSLLTMCSDEQAIVKETHGYVLKRGHGCDSVIQNALVSAYGKCKLMKEAHRVFDSSILKDKVSWNALIACYAQNGLFEESLGLLRDMMLSGFEMDVVTYSGIISPLSQNNVANKAIIVFKELLNAGLKPDAIAIASILPSISCLNYCREIHAYSYRNNLELDRRVKNALVSVYSTHGSIENAERVVGSIRNRDVISWSSVVVGYSQNQCLIEALNTYMEMVRAEVESNPITITSALSACAGVSGLSSGKELHLWAIKNSVDVNSYVGSALIDMYAKCGRINDSRKVFYLMEEKNVVMWNSMIGGYAINGLGKNALQLFFMLKEPDDVSFIAALSACSHGGGLVQKGIKIFKSMKDFKVTPREAHYACMVDLPARSGRIGEALDLVKEMPLKASTEIWGEGLLGAFKVNHKLEVGLSSGSEITELGS